MGLLLLSCSPGGVRPEGELFPEESLQALPPQLAVKVWVRLLDSAGTPRAEVTADTAWVLPERDQTVLRGHVQARFFRSGELVGELSADSARVEERSGLMAAFGRVVARSHPEGRSLQTTELWWDRQRQQFFSSAPVTIITPREVIEGVGFEASHDLQTYRVFRVRGRRQ
ncbi:MAG: LPS export ABC transporter periplasmic protein LptC [Candidatus Kapabacteria bacterium]|nr:LPS export ABC transporter periplasmic protein LptC [Candidatus Kapabacteria bacterium]MDW8012985.1 LPS export ABC transporter periplasmic protein LptC [Bacteroidota bacterium]